MWKARTHKDRKAALTQILVEEKALCEAVNRIAAVRSQDFVHQIRWAKGEENGDFLTLFSRLAELNWIWGEIIRHIADQQKAFGKVFKDIYQEERIVEESRKALTTCTAKLNKLQKQLDGAKKKNDSAKIQSLEVEVVMQSMLLEHLTTSVESQTQKLELYKVDLVRKGLRAQAETLLTSTVQCQSLLQTQIELADLLPSGKEEPTEDVEEQMKTSVSCLSQSLNLYPPTNGGIDLKKLSASPSQSPANIRRSVVEAPLEFFTSKSKTFDCASQSPLHSVVHRKTCSVGRPLPKVPLNQRPAEWVPPPGTDLEREEEEEEEEVMYTEAKHNQVQMRRAQSGGAILNPPAQRKAKYLSTVSLDQHSEANVLEDVGRRRAVTDLQTREYDESETDSGPYSSTEELDDDSDPGYATVSKVRNGLAVLQIVDSSDPGYAIPIDALQEFFESQKRQSEVAERREEEGDEEGKVGRTMESPYQTFEEIRRQRELQLQQVRERSSEAETTGEGSESPGYSRVFDAVVGVSEPLRVAPDVSRSKLNVSPLPWQRSNSPSNHDRLRRCGVAVNTHSGKEYAVWLKPLTNDDENSIDAVAPMTYQRRKTSSGDQPFRTRSSPTLLSTPQRSRSRSDAPLLDVDERPRAPIPVPSFLERHPSGSAPDLLVSEEPVTRWSHREEEGACPRRRGGMKKLDRDWSSGSDLLKSKSYSGPQPVTVTKMRSGQAKVVSKRKHTTA